MEAIFKRRSIRKYTNQELSDEIIEKILKAGMAAPSAQNEQPWHFVIIKDKNILREIPKFHPYSKMLPGAGCAIVVCGDTSLARGDKWPQDCTAATQNMLLMATEAGIGSVWLGIYPDKDRIEPLKELLNLPACIIPFSIVSLGYPAETREPNDRYDASRVHINKWENL